LVDAKYFVWAIIATEATVFFIRGYFAISRVFKPLAKNVEKGKV